MPRQAPVRSMTNVHDELVVEIGDKEANMIRDVENSSINEALRRLRNELAKCDGTEGRTQARRNARRRTLTAMRSLRAALDREYPAIVERKEVVRRDPQARMKAVRRAGWIETGVNEAGRYGAAGVAIKRVAWKIQKENPQEPVYVKGRGWVKQKPIVYVQRHEHLFVPPWAAAIGPDNPTRLRQAKRSNIVKRAVLAEKALSLSGTEERRPVKRKHGRIQAQLGALQREFDRQLKAAA